MRKSNGFQAASTPLKFVRNNSVVNKTNFTNLAARTATDTMPVKTFVKSGSDAEKKLGFFSHNSAKLAKRKSNIEKPKGSPSIYDLV